MKAQVTFGNVHLGLGSDFGARLATKNGLEVDEGFREGLTLHANGGQCQKPLGCL